MGNFYFFRIVTNVWKQELDEYKKYEHGMSQIMATLTVLDRDGPNSILFGGGSHGTLF